MFKCCFLLYVIEIKLAPVTKQYKPGWGGTLIFYTYIGSGIFFRLKILNFNIFWVFRKMNIFGGHEDFVDIFGGHHKSGLY